MKMWNRQDGMDVVNNTDYITIGIITFAIIGLFSRNPLVFLVIGLLVTYLLLSNYYNKMITKLKLVNPRQSIKLFPGEAASVTIELENESLVPIVNGHLSFQVDSPIRVLAHTTEDQQEVNVPLSVINKRKTVLKLPIHADNRGVSKVRNIQYTFPHLLNFSSVTLQYRLFYYTEVIVFPKLIHVHGTDVMFQAVPGEQRTNFSPFEDVQSLIGTREYQYGDPFQRINWKATAKAQNLQTNMYEKVVEMTYVFIVNIADTDRQNVEDLFSYVAYVSSYATEKGLPYEVYINSRKPGRIPYTYVPEGEGKTHYLYTLETLARIRSHWMTVPFEQMVYRFGQRLFKSKTIILFGDIPDEARQMMDTWGVQGHAIFQVTTTADVAAITPWIRGAMKHAK